MKAQHKLDNQPVQTFHRIIYTIILIPALLWCLGIIFAPMWLHENDFRGGVSVFLYKLYSTSCHQSSARSFHLFDEKLGVCSRCTSIYFSFLLAAVVYPFIRKLSSMQLPPLWILLAAGAIMVLDGGLDLLDVWNNTFISREITGAILGFVLPFYIIPGTIKLFNELRTPVKVHSPKVKNDAAAE